MRRWYKYLVLKADQIKSSKQDQTADEHKRTVEGYGKKFLCKSRQEFFDIYFRQGLRLYKFYNGYLKRNIDKGKKVLSVGSGLCANELALMSEGYSIICSDIENYLPQEQLNLFPELKFQKFDVTRSAFTQKVDYIVALYVFYLFDKNELLNVFKNTAQSLHSGGELIFDITAQDNIFAFILDNILCPLDAGFQYFIKKFVLRKNVRFVKKHHGYRYKVQEIINLASQAGFKYEEFKKGDYVTELKDRLLLFSRLPDSIVALFGRAVPHAIMFKFVKR